MLRLHSCLGFTHSKLKRKKSIRLLCRLEEELISLWVTGTWPDSLASTLAQVQRIGGSVRERLSSDMTRLIGQLTESVQD